MVEIALMFLMGLTGGFGHCIGMCGGFVLTYSVQLPKPVGRMKVLKLMIPHLLYSLGRTITYAFLGGVLGLLGQTLNFFHIQGWLQIVAGFLMIIIGLELIGWFPSFSRPGLKIFNPFQTLFRSLVKDISYTNTFVIGLLLGFLPCGLVYAAIAQALSFGSIPLSMAVMFAFGLGTIPALLLVGVGANVITSRFKRQLFTVSAILVIALGCYTVTKGWMKTKMPTEKLRNKIEMIQTSGKVMKESSCCQTAQSPEPDNNESSPTAEQP